MRVMVLQRTRISWVSGLRGTPGAGPGSLPLDPADPELPVLDLEERVGSVRPGSSLRLEEDEALLEEKLEKMESLLWDAADEDDDDDGAAASCSQLSDSTSRDCALGSRSGTADPRLEPGSWFWTDWEEREPRAPLEARLREEPCRWRPSSPRRGLL